MFKTRVHGKFILSGEHAVLRGGPALVFPVKSLYLDLLFESQVKDQLDFIAEGPVGNSELNLVFWSLLERALSLVQKSRKELLGRVSIQNNIPLSAGLGASAALCVAFGRWFEALEFISKSDLFSFSRQLEDLFHGESSGVDIAVAIEGQPLKFKKGESPILLKNALYPLFYLSSSGETGQTNACVNKVKALFERDLRLANDIDREMIRSSELSLQALEAPDGFEVLADAITKARSCFERWGLADGKVQEEMLRLLRSGACAVKPTGSGGGGYILSLWRDQPDLPDLIRV